MLHGSQQRGGRAAFQQIVRGDDVGPRKSFPSGLDDLIRSEHASSIRYPRQIVGDATA
jgi:hypothetical protein